MLLQSNTTKHERIAEETSSGNSSEAILASSYFTSDGRVMGSVAPHCDSTLPCWLGAWSWGSPPDGSAANLTQAAACKSTCMFFLSLLDLLPGKHAHVNLMEGCKEVEKNEGPIGGHPWAPLCLSSCHCGHGCMSESRSAESPSQPRAWEKSQNVILWSH